jgi:hypothetical protein
MPAEWLPVVTQWLGIMVSSTPHLGRGKRNNGQELVNSEHLGKHRRLDHGAMTIRDVFFTRPPPPPVLSAVQRLDWFLNSIRDKNSLVVTGKLEEFDEPYRSEKPF